ncbi:MAG: transcription termination/antitermination protein NusG [Novosphingobium sp.]|nr:transcription termination/antitermination protein NusG [Novosphingobium sp.]
MKKWYVIQVFAGYESIIKADIEKSIEEKGLQEYFGQILIPSVKVKQFFDVSDENNLKDQQLFPGYMLIEMEAITEALRLISSTSRVSKLLNTPLSKKEIDRILAQIHGEIVMSGEGHKFEIGKEVEIKEGPFAGFMGVIESIDEESEKLTVMVSIFGRMTPVELNFDQVKQ